MQLKRYLVAFIVLLAAAATACGSAGERAGEPDKSGNCPWTTLPSNTCA